MKLAVFGQPIKHSKSPIIHQAFAKQFDVEIQYLALESTPEDFKEDINRFFSSGGTGCNVTLPFKESAFDLADGLSQRAETAGAVNTLYKKDGSLMGDNTDGIGLVSDLKKKNIQLKGKQILVLGAGGAARGAMLPLVEENPADIMLFNRTAQRAQVLADELNTDKIQIVDSATVKDSVPDIIINTTSSSVENVLPLSLPGNIKPGTVVYDMFYSKQPTALQRWANQHSGVKGFDGLGMLIEQAAVSFTIWTGYSPDTSSLHQLLRDSI